MARVYDGSALLANKQLVDSVTGMSGGDGVDPYDPAIAADPFAAYARLRDEAPVHHVPSRGIWVLSRFDDVAAALDSRSFSSLEGNGLERRRVSVVAAADPPEHTRLRRPAAVGLGPRRLFAAPERLAAVVGAHLPRGEADVVGGFAEPLACEIFAEVLGVRAERLRALRQGRGLALSPRRAYSAFFAQAVATRRERPGDDLLSTLLGDDTLTTDEVVRFCVLLLAAGIDTTRDLVANALVELAARPEQWRRLADDPRLVPSAVEEVVRFASPIQAMFRTAVREVELAGGAIPQGARTMLLFGSANRDERRWEDAGFLDVGRYADGLTRSGYHLGFGAGVHACPGAGLARDVASAVLRELLERGSAPVLAGRVVWGKNPCFRTVVAARLSY